MSASIGMPNFRTWSAVILHRPHAAVDAIRRQLEAIGVAVRTAWPELTAEDAGAEVVFFDADLGYDAQFPWPPGEAPMPLVALLGSEAPGRVEWAIGHSADAHLLKPVGSAGVFSALVIARHGFAARKHLLAEIGDLRRRLARRPTVARAVIALMEHEKLDERAAFRRLRAIAMDLRRTIEDAAETVIARHGHDDDARDSA